MAIEYVDRPPRIQPELPVAEVQIPEAPEARFDRQSLLTILVPLATVMGFVFVSGSGNALMMIPMGLAMMLSVGLSMLSGRQAEREFKAKQKAYRELLAQMRQDLNRSHNVQRIFYHHNYPDVPSLLAIAARKEGSRFGARLWERRPTDSDFGALRLGIGNRPSTVIYKFEGSKSPVDETDVSRDARRLAADSQVLTGAPITIPLRPAETDRKDPRNGPGGESSEERKIVARHSIGIYGRNRNNTADFARALVAHFTAFHSSTDSRLYVLGSPESEPGWAWAAWLPHCVIRTVGEEAAEPAKPKQLDQLCFSPRKDDVAAFWKRIKRELDARQIRLRDTSEEEKALGADVTLPFLLVVVDLLGNKAGSPLASVASEAAVATINEHGPELGAAIIFLADDPTQIPSEAVAMTEVASVGDKVVFRYTEVGLNTPRYVGEADILSALDARQQYAAKIRRLAIRQSFGADLPHSVNMLEMQSLLESRKIETVDKLNIQKDWEHSLQPEHQEWLSVPIGVVGNQEVRTLVFSAKEGGDGVHGMIAGTTGSGKSELLLTLIAGMAIKYDPRIVNFVLVDFKGGSAFEPFRRLPHVVDILTNLEANSVERMFVALHAVMAERASLLARSNAKDIVDYRKKIIPRLPPDSTLPRKFPHLFIIVDEFAEMIAANPEYKAQFESVTRLGRAFGVSLILSTQRPSGVVTDQMRANMKFRLCLRVETPDDSKELLGRADAAFLPNLGGRGYIQVGNDILTALQVARAGGDYSDERVQVVRDVVWLDEEKLPSQAADLDQPLYSALEIAEALGMRQGEMPASMVDWIVGVSALRAKRDGVPVQTKPWPDPLPVHLSLTEPVNAEYLNTERATEADGRLVINKGLQAWAANTEEKPLWQPIDWKAPPPLRADIGLVDNPYKAEQRLLTVDVTHDPIVVFGASGRGKSTFIKSLLLALAAERTPNELHIYAFDFGRGGLKALRSLPHLGANVDASETARVDQLMRMLRNMVNERQDQLAKYASLAEYNLRNPNNLFPDVIVVIDNFAEFRENFEHQIGELMALIRDGRAYGIYFVIATNSPNDLGGKLYNLLTQRLTMTQPDPSIYTDIVGSGARRFDNVPGRGLVAVTIEDHPVPLEFHVGMPGSSVQTADTDRPDPYQELAERMERVWAAMGGKRPAAELPRSVNMLDMFSLLEGRKIEFIGELPIAENWRRSMMPEHQEWLRSPFGLVSSKEVRTLVFQAQADGVHGMIAGTTGSGKSELLLTMIAAMGIKYDPRIVNFVLVDFKGGAAFEPFKKMPHVVDIATNLQGNAVERIFIAIRAEMDRRAKLLADGRVGDLVDYRRRVIPRLKPGDTLAPIFPHLFVIVDEFAEMVAANPEYRLQFESITRLGRAFGVTLILSTQRPAGVVSDQMRANMKFRVCLRVETPEDSKELLGRPDAARLPQIGGRGYIQAGTETLTEVQVARSGGDYTDTVPDPVYPTEELLDALGLKPDNKPGMMIDWVVGALAAQAKRDNVPPLYKPWPDPLPKQLPLNQPIDANYIAGGSLGKTIVINPAVADWMNNTAAKPIWPEEDWKAGQSIRTAVGIVDNPYLAEQRILNIDLASDPVLVLGAAGRGKTVFLKSLLISLAAAHSPAALHIYALDFARGGLKALRALPHVAGVVDAMEEERVERLMRMLRNTIDDRQQKTQAYDSLQDYNAKNPTAALPAVVVAVDNVSEFKETYDRYLPDMISLVRDGRSFGVSFIMTAQMPNDVPGKLAGLLTQRLTFTLSDPSEYSSVLGRGWPRFNDEPGRGLCMELVNDRPQPLEFHAAIPMGEGETDYYRELVQRMAAAWATAESKTPALRTKRPKTVEPLAKVIDLQGVLPPMGEGPLPKAAPIGVNDFDREPTLIELDAKGPHLIVVGPPVTGKTTAVRSLVLSLAHCYSPAQVAMVFVDPSDATRRFYSFGGGGENSLENLPHVLQTVTTAKELDEVVKRLQAEYDELVISRLKANKGSGFTQQDNRGRSIVVVVDHYDDAESLNKGEFGFNGLSLVGKGQKLHFVICGTLNILRNSSDEFRRRADSARYSLVLQDFETVRYMGVRGNFSVTKELPVGRGFLVKAVQASLVQCAVPYVEGKEGTSPEEPLNSWLSAIRAKYPKRAQWSYGAKDLAALEEAIHGEAGSIVAVTASAVAAQSTAMAELDKLMAMQADLAKEMAETEIPDAKPENMVSFEEGKPRGKSPKKKGGK
jgi:DNA segregation ATPase FtsK/SpoIIIE-like protein